MDEHAWLAQRFEEHRSRLRAVAYRTLGSLAEADEAVQDAWAARQSLGRRRDRQPQQPESRLIETECL